MLVKKWSKEFNMSNKAHKKLKNGLDKKLRMQKNMQKKKYKIWKVLANIWNKRPDKVSKELIRQYKMLKIMQN